MKLSSKAGLLFVVMGFSLPIVGRLLFHNDWDEMRQRAYIVLLATCFMTVLALSIREKLQEQRTKTKK